MRILVTGHRGYLGSVLTCVLRHARFDVVGLDNRLFDGCDFGSTAEETECFEGDVREVEFSDLCSFDAVVHLAGLSDEASAEVDPELTEEINYAATVRLAQCCKQACVPRFLFASTCSVYGYGGNQMLDERTPPHPLTRYAVTKLRCERALLQLADDTFSPVILRNATAYGVSPRLRTDLPLNDYVGAAVATGRITLPTAGRAWQPTIHVADLARAYAAVLVAPDEAVHAQVFNVVAPTGNHRLIDLADTVTDYVPLATRQALHTGLDRNSFRITGRKLERTFPRLELRWTVARGVRQLISAMRHAGMSAGTWRSARYRRALHLQELIEAGRLDRTLRHAAGATV